MDRPSPSIVPRAFSAARRARLALWAVALAAAAPALVAQVGEASADLRSDWLVAVDAAAADLPPSALTAKTEPLFRGEPARFEVVLANPTDRDQQLEVVAGLDLAAFFVDASHGGALLEPETAPQRREIVWRDLLLPARSAGRLELTVVLRPDEDAGDVTLDVTARDMRSTLEQAFGYHGKPSSPPSPPRGGGVLLAYGVIFGAPLALLIFAVLHFSLGPGHRATDLAGRLAALLGAALLGWVIGFGLVRGAAGSYLGVTESTCRVLDRRADLQTESMRRRDGANQTTQRTYERPLIAAEYASWKGRQVAVGFASAAVSPSMDALADYQIGDQVTCWYVDERPHRFFVVRGMDGAALAIFGVTTLGSLVLLAVAFRPRRNRRLAAA